jgi:hypothetical protein
MQDGKLDSMSRPLLIFNKRLFNKLVKECPRRKGCSESNFARALVIHLKTSIESGEGALTPLGFALVGKGGNDDDIEVITTKMN